DGVVKVVPEFVRQNKFRIIAQLICNCRYIQNDYVEKILDSQQVYPPDEKDIQLINVEKRSLDNLDSNSYPFVMHIPPNSPPSVVLQHRGSDESKPCGIQYFVKIFTLASDCDQSHRRSTIKQVVRKVQYAPTEEGYKPQTTVYRNFMHGELELEVSLDKPLYLHGEKIGVNICVRNGSQNVVKKVKVMMQQHINVMLFSKGKFCSTITSTETSKGFSVNPGSSHQKVMYLVPTLATNCDRRRIALDGNINRKDTALASTTLIASPDEWDAIRINVSYTVKVELFWGYWGGKLCAELQFLLMQHK
ncbi:hypothetical protein KR067_002053, partial [Drosophila pandora]